jgi:acyl carrier protein
MGDPAQTQDQVSSMTYPEAIGVSARRREISERLKELLVDRLELAMPPEWIADDQPLFGPRP